MSSRPRRWRRRSASWRRAAHEGLLPRLAIERVDGEPVIGSGLEETLIAAGFSRQPRRLVASA